jgi:hypothetical protein
LTHRRSRIVRHVHGRGKIICVAGANGKYQFAGGTMAVHGLTGCGFPRLGLPAPAAVLCTSEPGATAWHCFRSLSCDEHAELDREEKDPHDQPGHSYQP